MPVSEGCLHQPGALGLLQRLTLANRLGTWNFGLFKDQGVLLSLESGPRQGPKEHHVGCGPGNQNLCPGQVGIWGSHGVTFEHKRGGMIISDAYKTGLIMHASGRYFWLHELLSG